MDDYDWQLYEREEFQNRFPAGLSLVGLDIWRRGALTLAQGNASSLAGWAQAVEALSRRVTPRQCPRVFISHRQIDVGPARRIAYEAHRIGYDYWLDVIDLPSDQTAQVTALEQKLGRPLTPFELAVLQAALIELALVNCTHAIAVMTSNTAGSQWVPYEYGRVADRSLSGDNATSWCDTTTLKLTELPDYLHLAPVHINQREIRNWLTTELAAFPMCAGRSRRAWKGPIPKPLPTG